MQFRAPTLLLLLLVATPLVGCGDRNVATGELGRVQYSLHSDYLTEDVPLTMVSLVTGHVQPISTSLTDMGESLAGDDASTIVHTIDPAAEAILDNRPSGADDQAPDIDVTVNAPGTYMLEATLDGDLFDRIELTFDSPDHLDLLTRVRVPYGDDWDDLDDATLEVGEGSQLAFLPIPIDASGTRLAGNFEVEIEADPAWAVAPAWNVWGVYEQNIVGSASPASLYFVEPGFVTVTLTDVPNGVSVTRDFQVLPVDAT